MMEGIKAWFHNTWLKIKNAREKIVNIFLVILTFICLIVFPNALYTLFFLGFFAFCLDKLLSWLIPLHYFIVINWLKDRIYIRQMSQATLSKYHTVDVTNTPTVLQYKLNAGKDCVYVADDIQKNIKKIYVNPLFSDLHLTNQTKAFLEDNKVKMISLFRRNVKTFDNLEVKAMEESYKIINENSVLESLLEVEKMHSVSEIKEEKKEEIKKQEVKKEEIKTTEKVIQNEPIPTTGQ